ncbi:helix-turn-helix domain-containing protein [Flavobacterium aurantiibacter]|jgi:L-fucose isomerase-like protein|uniref:DNA-binding protein n=1 Tax=Flavobacterium aurantiibacter TaxID=2023067 RepID=A0A255ZVQ9_9FLAO|nr:helix-turn-helix domain-containing protein [Flavobacterium aurantiibacter]OYQ45482.1 hypothetical protein CHX27_06200 [Flavobacterium aurantiibacter]
MSFYRFSEEEVQDIKKRLEDISLTLKQKQRTEPDQVWYDNQEFLQIMNISKRTAAYWRTENIIGYSQVGNKIYYRLSEIMALLDRSTIPANQLANLKFTTDGKSNDI